MAYLPHTDQERAAMLRAIGVERLDDLFADVPAAARFPRLELADGLSELDTARRLAELAAANTGCDTMPCFLGAGAYHHFTPALIPHLLFRGEFYTAYTPYQPEVSQGTLQTAFEFQSMLCSLFGLEVANASMYDGSTACAEAALMALRLARGERTRVLVSDGVHPQYREVLATYTRGMQVGIDQLPLQPDSGQTDPQQLGTLDQQAAVVVQYPNFYGQIEPLEQIAERVHAAGALLVVVADPVACCSLRPPGELGADIVVAEGQPLGLPLFYGGPYVGLFATRAEFMRQMPGRLIGMTRDGDGRRGFVLTLKTREQDIRREKATSNICTNEALIATAVTIYVAALGRHGLRQVAEHCYHKAHYLVEGLCAIDGIERLHEGLYFREAAVRLPLPAAELNQQLRDRHGIIGGYDLGQLDPELAAGWLVTATEMNRRDDIDRLLAAVGEEVANR